MMPPAPEGPSDSPGAASLPAGYFDAVYAASADPWQFETSDYERVKYAATVAALPRARYRRGFEIGCSIGVLTALLAARCNALLSVDVSDAALARARERLAGQPQVRLQRLAVPDEFPDGAFDLVVLSEVGYYWSAADLARAADRIVGALEPGGTLLLVHWTPVVDDYPLTGDAVHAHFLARSVAGGAGGRRPPLRHAGGRREATYRLDVFTRADDDAAAS